MGIAEGDMSALEEYRRSAREWLSRNLERATVGEWDDSTDEPSSERISEMKEIQMAVYEGGFAGITFPKEYGGQGLTLDHERAFAEEAKAYDVPRRFFGVSINILGAALVAFGSHEQKLRHLPRILSGQELWLQFLSEPSGGSDLAGLLTSAVRDGDSFVVNGQKTWSTGAHLSDFALCPVRTRWDVPKHKGISMLIVDLRSPGIEIRRIRQMNEGSDFCEEFFTDVVVPVSNLVGRENEGWRVTRGILDIEHAWVGRGGATRLKRIDDKFDVADLVGLARQEGIAADLGVRRRIAVLHAWIETHKQLTKRVSAGVESDKLAAGYGGLLKLSNDEIVQRRAETALALAGARGVVWETEQGRQQVERAKWAQDYLTTRCASIAGGTDEMQRNNISERVLGLPREASPDRDAPFNEVAHN